MPTYVALPRGINVGGKSVLPMAQLKRSLEEAGFEDVRTVIASGNVAFAAPTTPAPKLEARIETVLRAHDIETMVVVRSAAQLRRVVEDAPRGWPKRSHRCYVAFLKAPLTPARVRPLLIVREGVDEVALGPGVVYFAQLKTNLSKSGLPRVMGTPVYASMTLRSFSTVEKLLAVAEKSSS